MMGSGADMLLNTTAYAMAPLLLFLAGNVAWAVVYGMVFLNVRRHGAVEIPAAAVASNFAWVTVWGLCYRTDAGTLFVWANRGAIVLELAVFGYVLFRGARHVRTPEVRRWFKPGLVASYVCWVIMLYLFAHQKYETPNGIISGMIVALYMSTLYVVVELSGIDASQYSLAVGWGKLIGNLCGSLFCVMVYPANHFLLSLCAITFVLDVIYLALFRLRKSVSARVPEPA
ncbi:MAG: hypothetical protein H7Z40_01250 [Phycisphaerae bacterium]|nr:hypothetical protein [Gemmatimonadaceae bacterium]